MDESLKSPEELQSELGAAVKAMRLSKNITQQEVATRADVAVRAIGRLESGSGSTVETLVRALKAMGSADAISRLAPRPAVSPIALLNASQARSRARRARPGTP
jgi:transcriptional regulator with XRE-family HTH domain